MKDDDTMKIGFLPLLTLVLLVLKATGYLNISWLLVFAPLWLPIAVALLVVLFINIWAVDKDE